MSLAESSTTTVVGDDNYRTLADFGAPRLETIDDCTANSKKSRDSRQSFDCRAVAGKRIRSHSWFTRLDEEVAAELSDAGTDGQAPAIAADTSQELGFAPLSPRIPTGLRGYAPRQAVESYDDAYDFEDHDEDGDWEDIRFPDISAPKRLRSSRRR
ncbi:hypothetical protein BD626DRAFT_573270 [Schizophyllum amplum]|uniref:Uncharacterized protein n=1 Tax=Schizophyllum amplum TaxID=97359 RepID=A0A550C1S3_9AGAR|nr:hypothetical protein BD626DRAFT_573270 [Auriculariopsis ampla]